MVIGVDFDNTIVCYDRLFHRIAVEQGLIDASVPCRKKAVRDALRRRGNERGWTELQGKVYGSRMTEAEAFPGVIDFFSKVTARGIPIFIISHKTRFAVVGPAFDLQQSARDWLAAHGFFDPARIGLASDRLRFGETREEKLRLIARACCTHFIDDLEETFREPGFPRGVAKILYGQDRAPEGLEDVRPARTWADVEAYVL